ncbi:MAG: NgoFVII family restriction endonuclease [Dysgonamonadaceae bacterium]|jgi:HKD family nuclease|nr:NgoFVII family restriction endonuclease [Dysgonamonadaceae bacterium]
MELLLSNYQPAKFANVRTTQKVWSEQLSKAEQVRIATGFVSSDSLIELKKIVELNEKPNVELLIGMHYFDGFTNQQYDSVLSLNDTLQTNNRGEIYLSNAVRFHGKLYSFTEGNNCFGAIVGSSNISSLANYSNGLYEVDCFFNDNNAKNIDTNIQQLIKKLGKPFSEIDTNKLNIFNENKLLDNHYGVTKLSTEENTRIWATKTGISFDIPMKTEPKSNLNCYFGKGRESQRGFVMPRPWYEVEIIVSTQITRQKNYPADCQFDVVTIDGYKFRCETNGQNSKNFRSQNDLKILGKWIKGKLENSGALKMGHPVTDAVLQHYGRNTLKLCATANPNLYLIDF